MSMQRKCGRGWVPVLAVLALFLSGCTAPETIVLLPDETGHVGVLQVSSDDQTVVLDRALATATHGGLAGLDRRASEQAEVEQRFAATLAAMPQPPTRYRIYFQLDSLEFTDESRSAVAQALTLLVGAEGGLGAEEEEAARAAGYLPISLGPRILRTETAAIAALSVAQARWGDL